MVFDPRHSFCLLLLTTPTRALLQAPSTSFSDALDWDDDISGVARPPAEPMLLRDREVTKEDDSRIGDPLQQPRPLTNIQWLHIPKCGTSFLGTIYNYACGRGKTLDMYIDPRYNNNTECRKSCYDFALMSRYPKKEYCTEGVLHPKFQTMHRPVPKTWKEDKMNFVAMFRRPSQRLLSAFHHVIMHAAGFEGRTFKQLKSACTGHNASCYVKFAGIKGCMARMLTGRSCAEDPKGRTHFTYKDVTSEEWVPADEPDMSFSRDQGIEPWSEPVGQSDVNVVPVPEVMPEPAATLEDDASMSRTSDDRELRRVSPSEAPPPAKISFKDLEKGREQKALSAMTGSRTEKLVKRLVTRQEHHSTVSKFDHGLPHVKEAIKVVKSMSFVGLTEAWDESICLFHLMFGQPMHPAELKDFHKGPKHTRRQGREKKYDESELEGEVDQADEKIYAVAKERFEELHSSYVPKGESACDYVEQVASTTGSSKCSCQDMDRQCGSVAGCDCGVCPASRIGQFYQRDYWSTKMKSLPHRRPTCSADGRCLIQNHSFPDVFSWRVNTCLFYKNCTSMRARMKEPRVEQYDFSQYSAEPGFAQQLAEPYPGSGQSMTQSTRTIQAPVHSKKPRVHTKKPRVHMKKAQDHEKKAQVHEREADGEGPRRSPRRPEKSAVEDALENVRRAAAARLAEDPAQAGRMGREAEALEHLITPPGRK